jgi:lysozyme
MARTINHRAEKLIKHFESLFLEAYQDPVGVWTIGWGHTGLTHKDGSVYRGLEITKEDAQRLFKHDMNHFESGVEKLVTVPLNDDQFGALVSFHFNTGSLGKSTLLKKLNKGDYAGAANEFPKWNKAGGKVLRGLTRRRKSEQNLFEGKTPFIVEV